MTLYSPKQIAFSQHRQVKQQIDCLLKNDIAALTLQQNIDYDSLLLKKNNSIVLEYVKNIYEEYNICDPLPTKINFHKPILYTPETKKTQKKKKISLTTAKTEKYGTPVRRRPQEISSYERNQSLFRNPNQEEYIDMGIHEEPFTNQAAQLVESSISAKGNYFNNNAVRASMSYFSSADQKENDQTDTDIIFRPSNLGPSNRIGMEILVEDESHNQYEDVESQNQSFTLPKTSIWENYQQQPVQTIKQGNQIIQYENSMNYKPIFTNLPQIQERSEIKLGLKQIRDVDNKRFVDECFRYCVGCEQALLDINIRVHERTCQQFQEVFEMSQQQIVQYLRKKISKFEDRIKQYSKHLLSEDISNLNESSIRFMQESRSIVRDGVMTEEYEQEYGKVLDISKKWCLMTEEINRVNWFLKIRERVKKEFEL